LIKQSDRKYLNNIMNNIESSQMLFYAGKTTDGNHFYLRYFK